MVKVMESRIKIFLAVIAVVFLQSACAVKSYEQRADESRAVPEKEEVSTDDNSALAFDVLMLAIDAVLIGTGGTDTTGLSASDLK
jgi:hypothetical protein